MYIVICGLALGLSGAIGLWIWQTYFDGAVIGVGMSMFFIGLFIGVMTYVCAYDRSFEQAEIVSCEEMIELIPVSDTAGEYLRIVGADELKYLYSYETEDGIKQTTINIDDTSIKYVSSSEKARLVRIEYSFANKFRDWLFSICPNCDYTFYIPEGSMIN